MSLIAQVFGRGAQAPQQPPGAQLEETAPAAPAAPPEHPLTAVLARQVLETHLRERHQAMVEADPSRLDGLEPARAALLIRAMGAAAHADGAMDPLESSRIERALRTAIADDTERRALLAELEHPPCLEQLARQCADLDTATRFYAVSVRAVRRGVATNQAYLAYLANRLKLPTDVVVRLNRRFDVPIYVR